MDWNDKELIKVLGEGGVAVMPTDTLYGIVGKAEDTAVVERIYVLRKRAPSKRCIILIGDIEELKKFSVVLSDEQKVSIRKYWPGPVSIVLECPDEKFSYLHRGTNSLAFRIPAPEALLELLAKVGPLVAPSANTEGMPPAQNVAEAKKYFGDSVDPVRGREGSQRPSTSNGVDLYVDGGTLAGKASKIIELGKDGSVSIIRN